VEACDQIRKIESRADAGKRDELERTRWMWLKNRVNWTATETLKWESMALERCVTGMAYEMGLVLRNRPALPFGWGRNGLDWWL